MSEEKSSQSMSISGGQFTKVQIGQAGRDLIQTQQIDQGKIENTLQPAEVVSLLAQLEALLQDANLVESQKKKAVRYLQAAQEEEPNTDYAATSLRQATKVFKDASATVEAGQGLWNQMQPIITKLLPWLGVAASFFA
ncbi:MAG: hypothetical protein F6K19_46605 [Cyanothece sp. SIO1E1]|nr:hypothetical protein [Cyanothece sp. SIO1E1]